jgi:hypothetical protein
LDEDRSGDRPLLADSLAATDNVETRDFYHHGQRPFRDEWHHDDRMSQDDDGLGQAASARSEFEHKLTIREAIKAYPMAIFWSLAVSMCVIMEGFDSILVPNFYAFPTFQRKCV